MCLIQNNNKLYFILNGFNKKEKKMNLNEINSVHMLIDSVEYILLK